MHSKWPISTFHKDKIISMQVATFTFDVVIKKKCISKGSLLWDWPFERLLIEKRMVKQELYRNDKVDILHYHKYAKKV